MKLKNRYIALSLAATLLCAPVALFTACTNELADELTNTPQNPALPEGTVPLSIAIAGMKPAFDQNQAHTRAGIPIVPGAVPTTDQEKQWKEGDKLHLYLILSLDPSSSTANCNVSAALQLTAAGGWKLVTDNAYVYYRTAGNYKVVTKPYNEKPVFVTDAAGTIIGVRPPADCESMKFWKATLNLYYAPEMEWETTGILMPKQGFGLGATPLWRTSDYITDISGKNNLSDLPFTFVGLSGTKDFSITGSRLRIYTGRPGDKVQMVATRNFTPFTISSPAKQDPNHTYTTTTDAHGNAYFYGVYNSGNTATISLPDVKVPEQPEQEVVVYSGKIDFNSGATAGATIAIDASYVW